MNYESLRVKHKKIRVYVFRATEVDYDLFSRWRALRGFQKTLKRRPRVATVALMEDIWVKLYDRDGPLGHKRPASTLLFVF